MNVWKFQDIDFSVIKKCPDIWFIGQKWRKLNSLRLCLSIIQSIVLNFRQLLFRFLCVNQGKEIKFLDFDLRKKVWRRKQIKSEKSCFYWFDKRQPALLLRIPLFNQSGETRNNCNLARSQTGFRTVNPFFSSAFHWSWQAETWLGTFFAHSTIQGGLIKTTLQTFRSGKYLRVVTNPGLIILADRSS